MTAVAVTGAAGPVGRRLIQRLCDDPSVAKVIAIDRRGLRATDDKVVTHKVQLKGADIAPLLDGADSVVHLAGSDPLEGTPVDHDLLTTTRVLEAVADSPVCQVLVRSSATTYGAWPDNPVPLSETAPLRPNQESEWVRTRVELEARVQDFAGSHPGVGVAVIRPCVTVSPDGPDELGRVLAAARLVTATDDAAPAQFVHADDVASALDTLRTRGATGVYNVAPDGALEADLVRALVGGGPRIPLPEALARRLTALGWRYQLAPTPPGFVPYVVHPWVVANDRLRALGWEPTHSNEEAFVAGHAAAPWASISPQRRQEIALGVAGGVLATATVAAGAVIRRRLRARR